MTLDDLGLDLNEFSRNFADLGANNGWKNPYSTCIVTDGIVAH